MFPVSMPYNNYMQVGSAKCDFLKCIHFHHYVHYVVELNLKVSLFLHVYKLMNSLADWRAV